MQNQDSDRAIRELTPIIRRLNNFVLTTHVNPDGDGLGSELALALALRQLGKSATILNHSETPENYRWLDPRQEILQFSPERDRPAIERAEAIFILDANQPERLRSLEAFVRASKAPRIVIDHHLDADPFAEHYAIDEEATSTGEIVYRLITALGDVAITKDIARALYAAIMTDTGSFRFPRTDPEIHRIAAHLIECGADPTEIYVNVYESWTPGRLRLLGAALGSLKTAHDGKLAYLICTQEMFRSTGTTEVETDNFTTYPMSVRGVRIGVLFNELEDGIKISFRSKGRIPVNELAKEFGGNGHLNAAGARLFGAGLGEIVSAVVQKSGKYITMD
ncbi:MAG TPA: bifunctional oligoribonuclease/PAP phosphatase NrnA [Bacteroidota bacterium]|nr:bifunctional oligoribonuclease/PAP phosphatase NrnA [Bacteroidota bacterium]